MPNTRALDAFHDAVLAINRSREVGCFIGKPNPDDPSTPIIDVPGRPGYVYVRVSNGVEITSVMEAYNAGTNRNPNIMVRVERRPSGGVITGVDPASAVAVLGDKAPAASVPPHTHSIASGNVDMVEGLRFLPGLMRPATGTGEPGGLYVWVEEFDWDGGHWPGGSFLMTPPSTSGMQAWCKVALNAGTGTLAQYTGTEYPLVYPMDNGDVAGIAVPTGYYPVGSVVLYNGQTEITGREKWYDARLHNSPAGSDIGNFVALTPDSDTRNTVQPSGDHPALILKNNGSQTDAPFQVQTSAGAVMAQVSSVGGLTVNEQGADADTRIEGDTDANLLFVDASTDRVGIGTNTPTAKFNVEGAAVFNDNGADVDFRVEGDTATNLILADASQDAVGVNQSTIAASAVLDVASTTKGVLIPRVTTTQRDAISSPATGLMIYNTSTSTFQFYNGSSWGSIGAGAATITVKESDGTPNVSGVSTVVVSNGTLTDDGGGQVTISTGGGGAGTTVYGVCNGRLTLTSGTPVTTSDVTAATTLYFTPYKGNQIGLYSGSTWDVYTFSELSLSLSGYTASKPYDIWAYNNSGTVTLDSTVWTDDTTRATALTTQDGVYVKSGDTTRRYLGTIRITSTTGQTEDSLTKRFVWNYHNRAIRKLYREESTTSWTYNSSTWRQARNSTTNQVELVCGVREDIVNLTYGVRVIANGTGTTNSEISIGVNSTTTPGDDYRGFTAGVSSASTAQVVMVTHLNENPRVGYTYYAMLESSISGFTITFYGADYGGLVGAWPA